MTNPLRLLWLVPVTMAGLVEEIRAFGVPIPDDEPGMVAWFATILEEVSRFGEADPH